MAFSSKKQSRTKEWILAGILFVLVCVGLLLANFSSQNQIRRSGAAAPIVNVAVMGDSVSDEYRAPAPEDNRGGAYAQTTFNWLELLVRNRNVNAGTWRNWGGHRRTGYEFNYSRSGATTASGLSANAHVAVGELVSADRVQIVFYQLGSNDFAWYNTIFDDIYSGRLSGAGLDTYIARVITNVKTALNEINRSGKAKIIVSLVPDITIAPAARERFPDATKIRRVSDAIAKTNVGIQAEITQKNYAVFNTTTIGQNILSKIDSQGNLTVGGEKISFTRAGDEPHHVQLSDRIHAGTVYSGIYANEWMDAINKAFNTQFQLFTDDELLIYSGIKQPTTAPSTNPTVNPTSSASPIATVTAQPTTLPTNTPLVTVRPTASPTLKPSTTPVATLTPTPTDPYARYCRTYRSFRSVLTRFLSSTQIAIWDKRCGI